MKYQMCCVAGMFLCCLLVSPAVVQARDGDRAWRCGWAGLTDGGKILAAAKELRVNAICTRADAVKLNAFIELAKTQGVEVYYWAAPIMSKAPELQPYLQVMRPEDDAALASIEGDPDPKKSGYQFGGDPLPGRHDVLTDPLLCFHHPQVVAHAKAELSRIITEHPDLTGIALDAIGYRNLRSCHCPRSLEALREWRGKQAADDAGDETRFMEDSLVGFINDLCAHIREARPGMKITIHTWPVFVPEPLYGSRLEVDYWQQTVAWYFEPYWSDERIAELSRRTVNEGKGGGGSIGVPFIGVFVGRPSADKPAERVAHELRVIREAAGSDNLGVYRFNDLVEHEKMRAAFRAGLRNAASPKE